MTASPFLLPPPIGNLLSRLPAYPGSLLFVTALNLALAKNLAPDVAHLLQDKKLRLRVTDTLFFSRRLSMEGDTELGLLVKNTLDAIELPVLNMEQFKPAQVLARLKARLTRR